MSTLSSFTTTLVDYHAACKRTLNPIILIPDQAWQAHVDAYNNSKQSATAYANKHGLVYSQMLYWSRKLSSEPKSWSKPKTGFVAVKINKSKPTMTMTTKVLGVLEFPHGIKLHLHSAERLNSIPNL
jgi:hypothetical protein